MLLLMALLSLMRSAHALLPRPRLPSRVLLPPSPLPPSLLRHTLLRASPLLSLTPLAGHRHMSSSLKPKESPLDLEEMQEARFSGGPSPGLELRTLEITSRAAAIEVLADLRRMPSDTIHAVDTEVAELDLSKSPLGQGRVICFSVYSGPEAEFSSDKGCALWVDTSDLAVLEVFQPWLEDEKVLKVWHNYGFDRHVLYNHGIDVRGFGGDTMHMARLWDASRKEGYSLEMLSEELLQRKKIPMKNLFGVPILKKDGTPGLKVSLPSVDQLQSAPLTRPSWIEYSAYDAQGTWLLHERLSSELQEMPWQHGLTLFDFYWRYWRPFGELLTDMEREGIRVDVAERLPKAQAEAQAMRDKKELLFRRWISRHCSDAWYMNLASTTQLQLVFFGGARSSKPGNKVLPLTSTFKIEREQYELLKEARQPIPQEELAYGVHLSSKENSASAEGDGEGEGGGAGQKTRGPRKQVDITLTSLQLTHSKVTKTTGFPATDAASLKELAGRPTEDPPVYGSAYEAYGEGKEGVEACEAIDALCSVNAIDTMLSNFILPLQENADANSRIHCSLNLNTETGRLSSRSPNLQNQPALEKDSYKIRQAFMAEEGNSLVVADYGQLELRLLAHMTECRSMIDAFKQGGCFHSRTAMGMFAHVRTAVEQGECLLEWDYSKGEPTAPLLKDCFGSERRRAKTLNFSIAYGKTAHGLSKDWGVSLPEAKEMLEKWYADRPEVLRWQQQTKANAHKYGYTRTLMGRYRKLQGIRGPPRIRSHLERAAINTPIQGGAADIMTLAMLKLSRSSKLKELGYRMLLQIHDEVILEGPEEHAEEARKETVACMENPFDEALPSLLVDLAVDAKTAHTWYEAK